MLLAAAGGAQTSCRACTGVVCLPHAAHLTLTHLPLKEKLPEARVLTRSGSSNQPGPPAAKVLRLGANGITEGKTV